MSRKNIIISAFALAIVVALALVYYTYFRTKIINGYTDRYSYFPGDTVTVYLNPNRNAKDFKVELCDVNGRPITLKDGVQVRADLYTQDTLRDKPWENGFGYDESFRFALPSDLKSGMYLWEGQAPFIVKSKKPEIVILVESNTDNAYNRAGGRSLYSYDTVTKKFTNAVSILRPRSIPFYSGDFLKWFQDQDYKNVGYICDYDMENFDHLKEAKLLVIVGHSEYWTRKARRNFDRFVEEGKHVIILSGNTMWWQVRYSEKGDQLICYKSFEHDTVSDPLLKTINWDQAALQYPILSSIGSDFGHAGFGTETDNGWDGYKIVNERSPLLAGTGLKNGDIIHVRSHEQDGAVLKGWSNGPIIDNDELKFNKIELIGYDSVSGYLKESAIATWIVLHKSDTSGIIINTGTTDWCSKEGFKRGDHKVIKQITLNMIDKLLKGENVFSPQTN